MTIGVKTGVGARPHRVTFTNPGDPVPDGDGGYTQGDTPLNPPALFVEIKAATTAAIEQNAPAGTSVATATHLVTGPFHPGVTTKTVVHFNTRHFQVNGVTNIDERSAEMILVCTEQQP